MKQGVYLLLQYVSQTIGSQNDFRNELWIVSS